MSLATFEQRGPVAVISLNRPDKLNAINGAVITELDAALDQAENNDDIRAIVLRGEGRAFSAGFDLSMDSDGGDPNAIRQELQRDFDIIMRFWHSPKPTIAAVHGYCLGSGMEMAVACDITLAAEGCRFGAPEVRFGSGIVSLILPWVIGVKQAKELLLTGDDRVSTDRALALGLINRVVAADELEKAAQKMALTIAHNDRLAVRLTKQAINRSLAVAGMDQALTEALAVDVDIECTETEESSAFNAILDKQGAKAALAWREAQFPSDTIND